MDKSKYIILDSLNPQTDMDMHYRAFFEQVLTGKKKTSLQDETDKLKKFYSKIESIISDSEEALNLADFFQSKHVENFERVFSFLNQLKSEIAQVEKSKMQLKPSPGQYLYGLIKGSYDRVKQELTAQDWVLEILKNWARLKLVPSNDPDSQENADFVFSLEARFTNIRESISKK